MTFYFYDEGPIDKEPICHNCGVLMKEELNAMGVTILRCPICGDWKEE